MERYEKISRKVHITRIFGTNKAGDIIHDIWADVERWDNFTRHTQDTVTTLANLNAQHHFQKLLAKFWWRDNPNDTGNLPNKYRPEDSDEENEDGSSRSTVIIKVCSPDEEDLKYPTEWIPIRCMSRIRMVESENSNKDHMSVKKFLTKILKASRENRKVLFRRIYHYDTSIDKDVEKAVENNPDLKAYVAKAYHYDRKKNEQGEEEKDETQYVEVELLKEVMKRDNTHIMSQGQGDQKTYVTFKNQYLIDESEKAKLNPDELGENDINPPYRLDPFQNIINISFGGMAVEFGEKAKDAPEKEKKKP